MSFLSTIKRLLGFVPTPATLAPGDRLLPCDDCKQDFVFDGGEQRFFKEKGFTDPKRCPRCRKKVRSRLRRRGRRGGAGSSQANGSENARPKEAGRNDNRGNGGGRSDGGRGQDRGGHHRGGRRHSVIDGDSPYADER